MMKDTTLQSDAGGGPTGIRFADAAAKAELARYLPILEAPQTREGNETEQVKANPSRTVWRCRLGDGDYYLKRYHSQSLWHRLAAIVRGDDARRELAMSRHLRNRGVAAIEVLAAGRHEGRPWMISRTVERVVPADVWHDNEAASGDRRRIRRTLRAMAALVGRMHAVGVLHHDLHGGNILLRQTDRRLEPVVTDLHRATRRRRLSREACAKDLAQLAHDRYHATTRTQRLRFLKQYLTASGAAGSLRGWTLVVDHFTKVHTARLYRSRDKRVRRRNRYFSPIRLGGGWRGRVILSSKRKPPISAAAALEFDLTDWRAALANPHRLLEGEGVAVVKDSPTSRVVRRSLTVGGRTIEVYIKRTRRRTLPKAATDMVRSSRALRAFRLGHELITRRMATALPVAALERRTGPWLHECILIAEAVDDATMLTRALDDPTNPDGLRPRDVAAHVGRLLRRLHDLGFAHRDLKGSNLLIGRTASGAPAAVFIDLDGLSRRWWVSQRRRLQGLMRLNAAMHGHPTVTRTDRLRALLAYLRGPGCGTVAFKSHWRQLDRLTEAKLARKRTAKRS